MRGLASLLIVGAAAYAQGRRQGRGEGELRAAGRLAAVYTSGMLRGGAK